MNTTNDRVELSIIVPVFNTGSYLKRCLTSIENQTFKNYELICVDDCSDDTNTKKVLGEKRACKYKIITLDQHIGAASARNIGMSAASGYYIMFLDSDDFFEETMLEKMFNQIKNENSDICVCGHLRINMTGNLEKKRLGYLGNETYIKSIEALGEDAFVRFSLNPWSYMIKRNVLIQNNIEFQTIHLNNDVYFVLAVLMYALGISICPEYLVSHTIGRGNQVTANYDLWTVFGVFTYTIFKEDINIDTKLYTKIMYLWLRSIPGGIRRCQDDYMRKQVYTCLSYMAMKEWKYLGFIDKDINGILNNLLTNQDDFEWIYNTCKFNE